MVNMVKNVTYLCSIWYYVIIPNIQQNIACNDFRTFYLHRHSKFAAHYSIVYIFKCLETQRFLDREGRQSTEGTWCTRIRKCQLTFKPLYTVACALQKLFLRANALNKWCLMSLHTAIFIPLTSSLRLGVLRCVGAEQTYFQ